MSTNGERTRLAVARMLLRPSNTLLLDEPTNHLDLDSKDVLLDALADYGGTLIFVSHDRYFVERLATKIVEVGNGQAVMFPGTYPEFLWRKEHPAPVAAPPHERSHPAPGRPKGPVRSTSAAPPAAKGTAAAPPRAGIDHDARKRERAEQTRRDRELQARRSRLADLEARIADRERAIAELEATMAAPGFYEQRDAAQPVIDRHQALMWEVGELMHQWESLSEMLETERGQTVK